MNREQSLERHLQHAEPAQAALVNRWIERRNGATMAVGARAFAVHWRAAPAPRPGHDITGLSLHLSCQDQQAIVWLADLAAIDERLVGEPFTTLPAPIKELVVQRLLADFIAALPAPLAASVELQALHWQAAPRCAAAVAFELRRVGDDVPTQGLIGADSLEALRWLEATLPLGALPPAPPPRTDLPLAVAMHLGRVMAPARQLRALRDGDVLRMGRGGLSRHGVAATLCLAQPIKDRGPWPCVIVGRTATLRAAGTPASGPSAPSLALDFNPQEEPPMTAPQALDFEVPVDVELARLSLSLAQIEGLQPGQSLELPQDVSDAVVTLRVHGQPIARGKLIVIGRALGVCVQQVAGEDERAGAMAR